MSSCIIVLACLSRFFGVRVEQLQMILWKKRTPEPSAGFTLMEVVVAITIFSVCISAVFLLYSSVLGVVENVEKVTGLDRMARITLDRIRLDLNGMHIGKQGFVSAREPADQQNGDPFLTLTSTSHLILKPDEYPVDIAVVRYYLDDQDDQDGYTLTRSDTALAGRQSTETREARKHILAEGVVELKILYVGEEGEELETWESSSVEEPGEEDRHFPRAFFISLLLREQDDADSSPVEYKEAVVVPQTEYMFGDES